MQQYMQLMRAITNDFSNVSTNITFIVDVSSSMSDADIDLSEEAINSIISQYNSSWKYKCSNYQFWGNGVNSGWKWYVFRC